MDPDRHLLIDGSNILHAWPELRALLKRDRGAARERLARAAGALHDAEHIRVSVVFDGRGPELVVEKPSGHETFVVLYSPSGMTADDIIERLVARSGSPKDCIVATDDRAERQTIEALGAAALTAADLATWLASAGQRQAARIALRRRENEKDWRKPAP